MSVVVVTQPAVRRFLGGPGFFRLFPEFSALKRLLAPPRRTGCAACGSTRARRPALTSSFVAVLRSLPDGRRTELKRHLGVTVLQTMKGNKRITL